MSNLHPIFESILSVWDTRNKYQTEPEEPEPNTGGSFEERSAVYFR